MVLTLTDNSIYCQKINTQTYNITNNYFHPANKKNRSHRIQMGQKQRLCTAALITKHKE